MILQETLAYLGQESSAFIGAAIGGFIMYLVAKGWGIYRAYKKQKASEVIPHLVTADLAVYQTLTQLLIETGADRAYVTQFHNGVYYISQGSHMKMSCSHEIVKEGIARVQDSMQDLLLSKFAGPMSEVLKDGVAIFDTDIQEDSYFKNMVKSQGTARSVAAVIIDGNIVEGSVVLNYIEGNDMIKIQNFDVVMEKMTSAAESIGFTLRGKR